jgi:site-specific recombinase XerD
VAIFLRGDVWWMEWRTRKERVVRSTGFRKEDRAKAQAVLDAYRLARSQKPKRSVVEGLLDTIYSAASVQAVDLLLSSLWTSYLDWMLGKGRKVAHKTLVERRGLVDRFVTWAVKRGVLAVRDVDVGLAREYVASLRGQGLANKTLRNSATALGSVWEAVGQLVGGMANPWKAACPDKDGSSVRRGAFTSSEEAKVLAEAKKLGHDWHLASLISRWTGLRYGDVARLDWSQVDLKRRCIDVTPSKTAKHEVRVLVPIGDVLLAALRKRAKERGTEGFVLPEHAIQYPHPFLPYMAFSRALEAAGLDIQRFTFHSWRHTFRTRLAEAGVADDLAMRLGGWTNSAMASHYDHAERLGELLQAVNSAM